MQFFLLLNFAFLKLKSFRLNTKIDPLNFFPTFNILFKTSLDWIFPIVPATGPNIPSA